jgi:hypothetical protein
VTYEPGDILACYGSEPVSRAISWGTFCPTAPRGLRVAPSHVSIVAVDRGETVVFESTTLANRPCLIRGESVGGVQCHEPELRVWDYTHRGGRVDVYRLTQWNRLETREVFELSKQLREMTLAGLTYDTGGALLSGTRVFQMTRLFPAADLESFFCSELVAFSLMRLHRLCRTNPTRFNPGRLCRRLVHEGTYRKVATHA